MIYSSESNASVAHGLGEWSVCGHWQRVVEQDVSFEWNLLFHCQPHVHVVRTVFKEGTMKAKF
jgi:hypothetical protein